MGLLVWMVIVIIDMVVPRISAVVPAFYIFGDSLIDPGNNKYLLTTAQAAFPPNGIDFENGRPTGRFCNGHTVADFIVKELGLPLTPPYHDPSTKGDTVLKGVSYASGGARILNESGIFLQNVQPFGKQVENFIKTRSQIIELLGEQATLDHLSKSIFLFDFGSNDYLNYMNSSRTKTSQQFQGELISAYSTYLHRAYDLGARKVLVFAPGPLGCIPFRREGNLLGANGKACDEESNNLVLDFDKALRQIVLQMNQQLQGLHMVFGTTYDFFYDGANNPTKYGFVNANRACCGISPLRFLACLPGGSVCSERNKYFFWDAYHPTEAINRLIADKILDGDTGIMYPMNLRKLAAL